MRSERIALLALALSAGACRLDKVAIAPGQPELVLHGVLNPATATQVVLLERTRSGRVDIFGPSYDGEVIESGMEESGATVTLELPGGVTMSATEDAVSRSDHRGKGVYRFPALPGALLQRGSPYRLTVQTTAGETLTATTVVPEGAVAAATTPAAMDRSRDTLALAWPATAGARAYLVRVESPYGPRAFFTRDTTVRLPGDLRNAEVPELPHVFFPGFAQLVTVSAVDSNFYDWYRSHDDAFSGEGLVSRVSGGLGVFGSLVRLRFDSVEVTAPRSRPIEGVFRIDGTQQEQLLSRYTSFEIWLESAASRSGQSDALSGRYHPRPRIDYFGCLTCGLLGSQRDGRFQLALLDGWSGRDTVELFSGELRGDTLVGSYRNAGGPYRYVRQP